MSEATMDVAPSAIPEDVQPQEQHGGSSSSGEGESYGVPRLVIREMVLENFKSYAGAQKVGPFHKSFSSVVGPNGSGKSNVIDAMLFVFGKRAKQLRLNKVSELIHNSTNHRNLEMARVSVYFHEIIDTSDDEFGYEVVPNSEFVVSRTAHRSNKSDYYINDRKSNFKEVTELLKGKGIDLDNNRFLILQGEVEQISMMKPKGQTEHETGLLEYLEDIIGTDTYIERIEETGKQLESLNEGRQGLVNRLKIAERERDGLEAAKKAAEAYIEKEIELIQSKRLISALYGKDATKNIDKISENVASLEDKLAEEREKCQSFVESLAQYEAEYNAKNEEFSALQKDLEEAKAEFKEFERKDITYREDIKHLKTKLKKSQDKAAKDMKKADAVQSDIQKVKLEIPNLEKRAEDIAAQVQPAEETLERMVAGTQGESEELLGKLRGVRTELAPWEKQIIDVKSRIDVAQSEVDMLAKSNQSAMDTYNDACAALKDAKETYRTKMADIQMMESQAKEMQQKVSDAVTEEAQAMEEAKRTESMVKELRGKVEQRKADASQRASHSAAMMALTKSRDNKKISGIRGRLGDLGAIDGAYDVAISTACPALDYVVVDTTSAAQRCVELLRSNKLGVATFLILEKQSHLKKFLSEKVEPPEGALRLFDLVKCNNEDIRLAFYFALRDTLVAKDLDQASRIAYSGNKRWRRVVTVKGEMINENGTMSGGGAKPRGGRMCIGEKASSSASDPSLAAKEAETAEIELKELTRKVSEARSLVSEATGRVKAAKAALADSETAITKAKMDVKSSEQLAQDLDARIPELKAATAVSREDAERTQSLQHEIAQNQKVLDDLEKKSKSLRSKAQELEEALENVGGPPLKKQRELVARLHEDLTSVESETAKKLAQIKNSEKQIVKLQKDSKKAEEEAQSLEVQHDEVMAQFKALEEEAFKVVEQITAKEAVLQEKESKVQEIKKEFENKQKEVSVIRQVEVDILNEVEVQKTALKEESDKKTYWENEYCGMTERLEDLKKSVPEEIAPETLAESSADEVQYRIGVLEEEMERMDVNPDAISSWMKADEECAQRAAELEAATADRDKTRNSYDELRKKRLEEFLAGFNIISLKLKEMYQMITMGGDAELELVDSLDPFSEGILFSVRPPKKSWKNIANLSGGEKTLSSLSLVFALHHFKPTPLYVMDEIDAALDFKNVSIVGNYIRERTKNAQFVIISLRNNMFELADRLVGIYKTDNATKSIPLNPGSFTVGSSIPVA
ncbi:hypothetical protein M9435_001309 [Picochlorum sp. BPE23]|nr:hypothetical protein M9435_001309 [Picochlorum sp. BPE23]